MKKIWLFGSYNWQGNPKALFMYMNQKYSDTHDVWWIADEESKALVVREAGYQAVCGKSSIAIELFAKADVYVTENVRESFHPSINQNVIIFNLWHGVGLKHVEFGIEKESAVSQSIMRKYIKNYPLIMNNTKLLVTSSFMEKHFIEDMHLKSEQMVRGLYPRNVVYSDNNLRSYNVQETFGITFDDYSEVLLFAPTWRNESRGLIRTLLPDMKRLNSVLKKTNQLLIIKMHPHDTSDLAYQSYLSKKNSFSNVVFWEGDYDIYEIFNKITVGIIDYSSIFYDLLEAGTKKFIRYIPDYEKYSDESHLIADYYENTSGEIATSFGELIELIAEPLQEVEDTKQLLETFFGYAPRIDFSVLDQMIAEVDESIPLKKSYPELHSFDIFDTIIRRKGLEPESVFCLVQTEMKNNQFLNFPKYLVERYPAIRHEVEFDTRTAYKRTTYERGVDTIEVTLNDILSRLQENYGLTDKQRNFLFDTETRLEIEVTEPRQKMIDFYFSLKQEGHDVLLISDMYLPSDVVRQMISKVDPRFVNEKMYLSSDLGYQKSLGTLYEYVFFNIDYKYSKWIHHGDNKHADGSVPRRYGIVTYNHDMDKFQDYENELINKSPDRYQNDAFVFAKKMQQYRWRCIDENEMSFNGQLYYSYAYIGSAFVPYVYWSLKHAISKGYDIVYFISRDGYFLKQIADVLIEKLNFNIKTKYIYASRKVWRVPSFINEVDPASFTSFGMFTNMADFDELVAASQLDEAELLKILPEMENYRDEASLKGNIAVEIRKIFEQSETYKKKLLEIAAQRRPIVLDYIKQEIDFSEKFSFVEFWGRGYTQDTFTRLLSECIDGDFINPFYYVRNLTDDIGRSVRHRFTTLPYDFSYFEPIFAQTPYKSIAQYQREEDGSISPVIEPQENQFHKVISQGLQDFASDFSDLIDKSESGFDRYLAEFSYTYQLETPLDSVIVENLSVLKDNMGIYGEPVEFAPKITDEMIINIGIENLKLHTQSLGMSLARSEDRIRDMVNSTLETNYQSMNPTFPSSDLSSYLLIISFPTTLIAKKNQFFYQNVGWSEGSRKKEMLHKGELIEVLGYEWTSNGTPRFVTSSGYLSAHKKFVGHIENGTILYNKCKVAVYSNAEIGEIRKLLDLESCLEVINIVRNTVDQDFIKTKYGYIRLKPSTLTTLDQNDRKELQLMAGLLKENLNVDKWRNQKIIVRGSVQFYKEPSLISEIKNVEFYSVGHIYTCQGYKKNKFGLGFLKTEKGYIIAQSDNVQLCRSDIDKFMINPSEYVQLIRPLFLYTEVEFNKKTKTTHKFSEESVLKVSGVSWSSGGTPRLEVPGGYISANKKFITPSGKKSIALSTIKLISKIFK